MKTILLSMLIIFGFVGLAYAMSDTPKPPTPGQIENIEKMKERDRYRAMPDCEGEFVTLEMDDVILRVPRARQVIDVKNIGTIAGLVKPSLNYKCEDAIENVVTYRTGHLTLRVRRSPPVSTSYESAHKNIFGREGVIFDRSIGENGVERIIVLDGGEALKLPPEGAASEYYILPKEIEQTENSEPVLYTCSTPPKVEQSFKGQCITSYYNLAGLFVHYKFHRDMPDTNFIIDRHRKHTNWFSEVTLKP